MARIRPLVVFALAACLLQSAGLTAQPTQDAKLGLDKLQGDWTMVSLESKGQKISDEIVKKYKLTIKGDQWIVTVDNGDPSAWTIKVDLSKNPTAIDFILDPDVLFSKGIYKLESDTMTVCRTFEDIDRPKEFKASDEANLSVWKRLKK